MTSHCYWEGKKEKSNNNIWTKVEKRNIQVICESVSQVTDQLKVYTVNEFDERQFYLYEGNIRRDH